MILIFVDEIGELGFALLPDGVGEELAIVPDVLFVGGAGPMLGV